MAIPLTVNGAVFEYPVDFDESWGVDATGWAQAVTNGMLQMAGGSFPLTSNVNFGPNFGLLSQYFQTRSASPASVGTVRLSSADAGIAWRNNANSANLILTTDASDQLLYNGDVVLTDAGGAFVSSIIGTANQVIASSPTGNVTLSTPQDIAPASSPTFFGLNLTATVTQLVLGSGNQVGISAPTPAASRLYTIPDTGTSTADFVMTEGAQTINGIKTLGTPLAVNSGGTGDSSLTAYAVLTGGTTSTAPIQSVASVGLAGQVLTSNGAAALPTFQNTTGSGTVNSGTATHLAYYATSSAAVSDANGTTVSGTYTYSGLPTFTGGLTVSAGTTTLTTGATSAANIAMGSNKVTGLAVATASGEAVSYRQGSQAIDGSTANSSATAGTLQQGTVSTPDFRANAVTLSSGSVQTNGGAGVSITTVTITTIGGKVLITGSATISGASGTILGKARGFTIMQLSRDSNQLATSNCGLGMDNTANSFIYQHPLSLSFIDSPTAGSHTYELLYSTTASGAIVDYNLNVVELRA